MTMNISLPIPSPEAQSHSSALVSHIQQQIEQAGGWIDFAQFMHAALYAPGLGYYSSGAKKFGPAGDFVTAPEISPFFGQAFARQIQQALTEIRKLEINPNVLELGAGTGRLARDLLLALEGLNQLPNTYFILEVSAYLREEQQRTLQSELPDALMKRVVWIDELPESFHGVILANEVLDALPVHIFEQGITSINEVGVGLSDEGFVWKTQSVQSQVLLDCVSQLGLSEGYVSEICLAANGLIASLAKSLELGAIFLIDYGFSRQEYYHPQRRQGTLMCHYRHHSHSNPFLYLGLQDITAHVDFTRVAEAGVASGLSLVGYINQAHFLINCGITKLLEHIPKDDMVSYLPQAAAVQKLLSPAEMGELFKVIAFEKNLDMDFIGFSQGDKSHTL
jgi:SAM-dependent MidA family methyltransferase